MTAPKTSDGAKPACVPFVAISGCCDRAQREKPGSSENNWCWQSYFRAGLGGRETSAHELALDVVRDQLLRRISQILSWAVAGGGSPRTGRSDEEKKRIKTENERSAECKLAGWLTRVAGVSLGAFWILMTAPGKIMESALLSGEVAWAFQAGLGGAILLRAACGFFRFRVPSFTMYLACLPYQYGKLCTYQIASCEHLEYH